MYVCLSLLDSISRDAQVEDAALALIVGPKNKALCLWVWGLSSLCLAVAHTVSIKYIQVLLWLSWRLKHVYINAHKPRNCTNRTGPKPITSSRSECAFPAQQPWQCHQLHVTETVSVNPTIEDKNKAKTPRTNQPRYLLKLWDSWWMWKKGFCSRLCSDKRSIHAYPSNQLGCFLSQLLTSNALSHDSG